MSRYLPNIVYILFKPLIKYIVQGWSETIVPLAMFNKLPNIAIVIGAVTYKRRPFQYSVEAAALGLNYGTVRCRKAGFVPTVPTVYPCHPIHEQRTL